MLDSYLRERPSVSFDFRQFAFPGDPLAHLFGEWLEYYRGKFAICRAIAPKTILEIGVRFGYSAITFLEACPDAQYLGLDNDSSAFGGQTGALGWARQITAKFQARFEVIDTQLLDSLPGERYDLIHVDGQQDGDGTYHDLELALEKGRWILVDGIFWSRQNLEASTHFLEKYRALIEYAVVLPGYAGDLLIHVREGTTFSRAANAGRDHLAIRGDYTRDYFLRDCGGYETFKSGSGRVLADARLITLFAAGAPWQGARVLDVGSGRGELAYACYAAGASVTGLDYSDAAVDIARNTYRADLGPRLEFLCEDVLEYRPRDRFDRIIAADFVEHVDPATLDQVIERLSRWLSPEGRLLVHTWPNRIAYDRQHSRRRRKAAELGIYVPRNQRSLYEDRMHLNEQTPARLRRALARHFGHAVVWVGSAMEPSAGLMRSPTRELLADHDSIYAVAAHATIDVAGLKSGLKQDALSPSALSGLRLDLLEVARQVPANRVFVARVEVTNGTACRLASLPPCPMHLSYHWMRGDSAIVFDGMRTRLATAIEPGESRSMLQEVMAPSEPGAYDLVLTFVQEGRFWLDNHSSAGCARIKDIQVR